MKHSAILTYRWPQGQPIWLYYEIACFCCCVSWERSVRSSVSSHKEALEEMVDVVAAGSKRR